MKIPFIKPNPPRLSQLSNDLEAIEASGIFTNYGPVNTSFEQALVRSVFDGRGAALTVCNATIGLMLAIRDAIETHGTVGRRYALMPSFTFAATAQAALWCGLTPLFCDIDRATWLPDAADEDRLLAEFGDEIAVVVPYATFGNNLDIARYETLVRERGVPVVVDAAASIGSQDDDGLGFGSGSILPIVFSMHATKTFATAEGGVIYSADQRSVDRLRVRSNFGFGEPRSATMTGLNSKLSEVTALLALRRLDVLDDVVARRMHLHDVYVRNLPGLSFQEMRGRRIAHQFVPSLLPEEAAVHRDEIIVRLQKAGIGVGKYFSPHLVEQPLFSSIGSVEAFPNTQDVSRRTLSLPLYDTMDEAIVEQVCAELKTLLTALTGRSAAREASLVGR